MILLFVILLLLIGGLVLLSRSTGEVPVKTIETNVTGNAAAN
ncbi:hypothetical protein [Sphingomonas sp.]|nr:hypothetical protein [Sphingomonas sp.]